MTRLLLAIVCAALLGGCAATKTPANTLYDFGPASAAQGAASTRGTLVVTDATGSPALDSERMFYRLNYADPLQARSYANSRWSTSPLQMLTQRLKTRIAQSGAKVLGVTDAAAGLPILRVDVDDFVHSFDSAASSYGQLVLRASLFQGHTLVDQKNFSRKVAAVSADAAGGTRAMAEASDAVAADIVAWLASLPASGQ
ncbi:MAG: ABC-type transport auxiliary lipoprotein family protein [Pseudomonadota bacterium]